MYHNKTWIEDAKPSNCLAYKDFHTNRHGRSMVIATDHNKRENSHDYSILDGISYKKRYYRHVTCFVLLLNEYFNNLKVTRKPEWPEHDYCSLAHITAMGSLGGLSLHTTNDESYTPVLTGLSYKNNHGKITCHNKNGKMIKTLHILVTDLNHNVRDFLTREFKKEGCVVYTAKNTIEAEKYIYGANQLDMVILDPEIPALFEQSLFKEVQDRLPPVPVIIHTYKEFFNDMLKDDNVYFVEKNACSIEPLKETIIEIAIT